MNTTQATISPVPTGLWIDETNAADWQKACRASLSSILAPLAGITGVPMLEDLSLVITPPDEESASLALKTNHNLVGKIEVAWGMEGMTLEIPMPYHGVFLFHRPGSGRASTSVWTSWLTEAPGFRLAKPVSGKKREAGNVEWRLGMPGGWCLSGILGRKPTKAVQKQFAKLSFFGSPGSYPEWLRPHLAVMGLKAAKGKAKAMPDLWADILKNHRADMGDPAEASDADDLNHRILMTFPVWLHHHIAGAVRRAAMGLDGGDHGKRAERILAGLEDGNEDLAREIWAGITAKSNQVAFGITAAIHGNQSSDPTDFVDPINPVDLAARISRVKRIDLPASKLAEIPADFRQNHPSFQGRLCPVDSPESEQVGLTLHLATGAQVDLEGRIHPTADPVLQLGMGAGMIPFYQHNDGARDMMGAKNLRQAVPTFGRARAKVETGGEESIKQFTAPLVKIGVCPEANDPKDMDGSGFALGRDLLVAYMPWEGWNFEDAVVVGEQVVNNHWLDLSLSRTVHRKIPVGWVPCDAKDKSLRTWSDRGLARIDNQLLHLGSPIARFEHEGAEATAPLEYRHDDRTPVILKSIRFTRRYPWMTGVLEYELATPISLKPGDKLMGRHGNKGVVGKILPFTSMPRLPDSEKLPEQLRGQPIDILLNPHGVISRMNLGQLLETHLGWLLHSGEYNAQDLVRKEQASTLPGRAFADCVDHDRVREGFDATGLDRHGRIKLVLPDGGETSSPVVVGFQHIVRLKHIPETKSQARRGGLEARYSVRTGQAIHGRKQGGGQRLGEMEEWALSAHGADHVITEMLGIKSTAELAGAWSPDAGEDPLPTDPHNGFAPMLKDWLFAILLDCEEDEHGKQRLALANEDKVIQYAGPWGEVTSDKGVIAAPSAAFCCAEGGKRKPCEHRILGGKKVAFPTTAGGKVEHAAVLTLRDLLAHFYLRAAGPISKIGIAYQLPLTDLRGGKPAHPLNIEFRHEAGSDQLKAVVAFAKGAAPTGWHGDSCEVHLYGRFGRGKEEREQAGDGKINKTAEELIADFQKKPQRKSRKADGVLPFDLMRVSCPQHSSKPLTAVEPYGTKRQGLPGGLFDPNIFGDGLPQPGELTMSRWGYIKLPISVPYPVDVLGVDPLIAPTPPNLELIPVLPTRYRWGTLHGDTLIESEIDRRGYAPLIRLCHNYDTAKSDEQRTVIATRITKQVIRLFGILVSHLSSKSGLIRRHGLGRRVDRTSRMVVTPNPQLEWDHVGIPAAVLLELIGDIVADWKRKCGRTREESPEITKLVVLSDEELKLAMETLLDAWNEGHQAEKEELVLALLGRPTWREVIKNPRLRAAAEMMLYDFLKANPDFVVLLNRQPSLHRDSFQAFHPVPLPAEAGDVIQLCPLACKGFGADFDGDEMVIHVPLNEDAQNDARKLLPSSNLFSMANQAPNNVLAHFDQDFVLGTWWIGADESGEIRNTLLECLPQAARKWFEGESPVGNPISKDQGLALLYRLANKHPKEAPAAITNWMRLAFRTCTRLGISFSYFELLDLANGINSAIIDDEHNADLDALAQATLKEVLQAPGGMERSALHFAAMALSGARGKKQVRQLIAARGHLDPGATGFDRAPFEDKFRIGSSLVAGMVSSEAFWAAMNARSSMCDKKLGTGHAGGLTRHLVFAMRSHVVMSEDCGNGLSIEKRSPVGCKESQGLCSMCHGKLPNQQYPAIGFPAGLVAAQSIGERGTQLSMQSFHSGTREIDIQDVRRTLGLANAGGTKDESVATFEFLDPGEAENFVGYFHESDAYKDLEPRHFQLLWIILHRTAASNLAQIWREFPERTDAKAPSLDDLRIWWRKHSDSGQQTKNKKNQKPGPLTSLRQTVSHRPAVEQIAYQDPDEILFEAIHQGVDLNAASPLGRMLL